MFFTTITLFLILGLVMLVKPVPTSRTADLWSRPKDDSRERRRFFPGC